MPTLRNVALTLSLLVCAVALSTAHAEPLPRQGYVWRWARSDAAGWCADGAPPKVGTWVAIPEALRALNSKALTVDGGAVRLKTQPELDTEAATKAASDLVVVRTGRLSEFLAARDSLESLLAAKAEMVTGAKVLTRIDARITAAQARKADAFAVLKDLP